MREPPRADDVPSPVERTNWTTIALIGGLALLALIVIYFATRGNSDQDKLTNSTVTAAPVKSPNPEKLCASGATYDLQGNVWVVGDTPFLPERTSTVSRSGVKPAGIAISCSKFWK